MYNCVICSKESNYLSEYFRHATDHFEPILLNKEKELRGTCKHCGKKDYPSNILHHIFSAHREELRALLPSQGKKPVETPRTFRFNDRVGGCKDWLEAATSELRIALKTSELKDPTMNYQICANARSCFEMIVKAIVKINEEPNREHHVGKDIHNLPCECSQNRETLREAWMKIF